MNADPPMATAVAASIGTVVALIAYCCWGIVSAARIVRMALSKGETHNS